MYVLLYIFNLDYKTYVLLAICYTTNLKPAENATLLAEPEESYARP